MHFQRVNTKQEQAQGVLVGAGAGRAWPLFALLCLPLLQELF